MRDVIRSQCCNINLEMGKVDGRNNKYNNIAQEVPNLHT